jgi:hypothetical protein
MHGPYLSRRSAFRFAERSDEPHLIGERDELRIGGPSAVSSTGATVSSALDAAGPDCSVAGAGVDAGAMPMQTGDASDAGAEVIGDPRADQVAGALGDSTATRKSESVVNGRRSHVESNRSGASPTCSTSSKNSANE